MEEKKKIVKLLFRKKAAMLVEYQENGIPVRVSIPSNRSSQTANVSEVEVSEKVLREGIPYGVPWAMHVVDVTISAEQIENELHKAGIWTIADFRNNPGAIQGAILSAASSISRSIMQTIKEYSSKEVTK